MAANSSAAAQSTKNGRAVEEAFWQMLEPQGYIKQATLEPGLRVDFYNPLTREVREVKTIGGPGSTCQKAFYAAWVLHDAIQRGVISSAVLIAVGFADAASRRVLSAIALQKWSVTVEHWPDYAIPHRHA